MCPCKLSSPRTSYGDERGDNLAAAILGSSPIQVLFVPDRDVLADAGNLMTMDKVTSSQQSQTTCQKHADKKDKMFGSFWIRAVDSRVDI